jgi:hypothetical protein
VARRSVAQVGEARGGIDLRSLDVAGQRARVVIGAAEIDPYEPGARLCDRRGVCGLEGSVQGGLAVIFVVLEEVYSPAPDGSERELVRRSQTPLFADDRKAPHSFAKERVPEFDAADYHADAGDPYFSGRDVAKRESHRFIVKPAMPA